MSFEQAISQQIWEKKYQFKSFEGEAYDKTVEDTWWRIAYALADVEKQYMDNSAYDEMTVVSMWAEKFYTALEDFKFIPAGRIVSGAGTQRNVTLSNCYVMGNIEDDMGSIFEHLKEAALTMQQGGGIGYCFSSLRPSGAKVKGVDSDASGPLTFMDVWDSMCRTIMSAGERRGAMMATMHCWHPDIEKFIEAKRDPSRLRMFNMSVLITDDFMEAVKSDSDWNLVFDRKVYKTVKAKSLWDKIMLSTYHYAEPGVIFIDRINQMNNLSYMEEIVATNPCGEQPLPPYGACLLGSINLAKMVKNIFTDKAEVDYKLLTETVIIAIRMMDNVNDASKYPLQSQYDSAQAKRRIGLGVTGVADMFLMMGIRYGSQESVILLDRVMEAITDTSYITSIELAKEKGSFPALDKEAYVDSGFMRTRNIGIRDGVRTHGIRNALLTSIAPTGTISMYANNVSSGIEPIFAPKYERKILNADGTHSVEVVKDYAIYKYEEMFGEGKKPPNLVTAQTITPSAHIRIQAVAQKHIDSSISKTTNCPEDINFDDFKDVYMLAWDMGCKGCTTYRPNEVTGSVLTAIEDDKPEEGGACTIEIDPDTGQMIRTCDS